jgi:biotin transport system substrate-specific component
VGGLAARPISGSSVTTGRLAGVVSIAVLTVVGANIYIPWTPVPFTLQTLFVLLAGAVLGGRFGSLAQLLYVGVGTLGLPVFAGRIGGTGVIAGPTGGYLIAFLFTPFVVGALIRQSRSLARLILAFSAGTALIFALGVAHLALFYTSGVGQALQVGFLPFFPGAIVKIAVAASIHRSYSAWLDARRRPR